MSHDNPTHLFISYAIEDSVLADWLARKLVGPGYAVWLDRLKLLGGELRKTLLKYKLHTDQELFDRAYAYIKQYY